MAKPEIKPQLHESLSGAFFVKKGNEVLGGFHKKENAELFLEAYLEKHHGNERN